MNDPVESIIDTYFDVDIEELSIIELFQMGKRYGYVKNAICAMQLIMEYELPNVKNWCDLPYHLITKNYEPETFKPRYRKLLDYLEISDTNQWTHLPIEGKVGRGPIGFVFFSNNPDVLARIGMVW